MITIESLHREKSTRSLKHILGNELIIVYLHTPLKLRQQRSREPLRTILQKDQVKKSRGAHLIQSFADIVHLNRNSNLMSSFNDFFQTLCCKMKHLTLTSSTKKNLQRSDRQKYEEEKNITTTRAQWLSEEFVLSAGAVIFNSTRDKVCLIKNEKGEFFLPKGRKNVGESLEEAALRESYEETGYQCELLPVTMPSRATPISDTKEHLPDLVRMFEGATEPIAISTRPSPDGNQKIIFWFLAVTNGTKNQATQMENENFRVDFYTFEEALQKLTFEVDRKLIQKAIEIIFSNKK